MPRSPQDRHLWTQLLECARACHMASPELTAFCPFPDDLTEKEVTAYPIKAAELLAAETAWTENDLVDLRDAFIAAGPLAHWRETYKGTDIGQDFMDRFACYCLIGVNGPFHSNKMWAWVVYMPEGLHYPWHHHPGEEMYLTLAGEATFMRSGAQNEVLRAGQTSQHASNQPHAMETHDHPVMAYVVWRNGFETPPVLTQGEVA